MKKIIVSVLIITMMFSMSTIVLSAWELYPYEGKYNTCDLLESDIVENIDNYFVPEAYDVSPFTGYYNYKPWQGSDTNVHSYEFVLYTCEEFYTRNVKRKYNYDMSTRVIVPPIYSFIEPIPTEWHGIGPVYDDEYLNFNVLRAVYYLPENNLHNLDPSETMWQVLRDGLEYEDSTEYPSTSQDAAIRAYLAPWTLYNNGNLYTWTDLMKLSDDEINNLNFKSFEFEKFIKNVKEELEVRGWWKEEYQELYDMLYVHKDDYYNSQNKDEMFVFNGENVYMSKLYEDYNIVAENPSITNIVSIDIYQPGFMEEINKLDDEVLEKYNDLIVALEDGLKRIDPQTGDNSVLYVIIAAASLTAMSAMVVRRKRRIEE